jgi:hypothetical protein
MGMGVGKIYFYPIRDIWETWETWETLRFSLLSSKIPYYTGVFDVEMPLILGVLWFQRHRIILNLFLAELFSKTNSMFIQTPSEFTSLPQNFQQNLLKLSWFQ